MSERLNSNELHVILDEPIYVLDKSPTIDLSEDVSSEPEMEAILQYKGGFSSKVVVLVNQAEADFTTEAEEAFLLKVIEAVNMGLEDIAIINLTNSSEWANELQPGKILGFGISTDVEPYEVHVTEKNTQFYGYHLSKIMEDVQLKRKLWEGLKIMFPK